jgi:predicted nicotinamide N-methyase
VVAVSVAIADDGDQPSGAVVSGLYLWPAASYLAEYLVRHYDGLAIQSVVELGAGCGLVSLTALQLWQDSLQCIVVTDHDPNTLGRARDNLESTLQALIMDEGEDDDHSEEEQDAADQHLNGIINSLASIPVAFESLEWGDMAAVEDILRHQIREHSPFAPAAHMILGSDLIYDCAVVEPVLRTAHSLMAPATGRFLLCQSVPLTDEVEAEVVRACHELRLQRRVLVDHNENNGGGCRIEEFSHQQRHCDN